MNKLDHLVISYFVSHFNGKFIKYETLDTSIIIHYHPQHDTNDYEKAFVSIWDVLAFIYSETTRKTL